MLVLADYHVTDFRQIHWPRSKISLTRCREQKAAFLSVGRLTLWSFGLCERSTIILVEMFSEMCCLKDDVSRNCHTNTVARSGVSAIRRSDRWLREEYMLNRWVREFI